MAIKITRGSTSADDRFAFSEDHGATSAGGIPGWVALLTVRGNDGKNANAPLYSLDDGQSADLAAADGVSSEAATADRSRLGAKIWIQADGRIGYSTVPIAAMIEALAVGETLQDSFLYASRLSNGSLVWQTVTITITGTNDRPVAMYDTAAVAEGSVITGSVASNDMDVDRGAVLRFLTTDTAPGFALASDGSWVLDAEHPAYQSLAAGEAKTLSIGYTVTDQHGASARSLLTITVTGTNDGPVASAVTASVSEDGTIGGTLVGTDPDQGDVLEYAVAGEAPQGFALGSDGHWSLDTAGPAYQQLAAGETRTLTIGYTATDRSGASSASTLTITIVGTNDAPVAAAATATVAEDSLALGQLAAKDPDLGAALTFALAGHAPAGFALSENGSWTFDAAQAQYQALAAGETRNVSVAYAVIDEHGDSGTATLNLTIEGRNDAPVASAASADVTEDGSVTGRLTAADPDRNAQLTYAAAGELPSGFSLQSDGGWTFDAYDLEYQALAEGEARQLQIDYRVTDEHGAQALSTLALSLTGVNDTPVTTSHWAEANEGEVASGQIWARDLDSGAQLRFAVDGEAPAGFSLAEDGSWTFNASDPAYRSLAPGDVRMIQVNFSVADEHDASISSFLLIALNGTNEAPVLTGDPATLPGGSEDTAYTVTAAQLLAGWSDGDGDTLYVSGLTAANATVLDNLDGSWTITPAANWSGTLALDYLVTDGWSSTAASRSVIIAAVNDPAVIGGTRAGTVTEATARSAGTASFTGQLTISDIDSSASFQARTNQVSSSGFGTFSVNSAGLWTYRLDNANPRVEALSTGEVLSDSFSVNSADGTSQVINITIHGQTDPVYTPPPVSTAADPNDFDMLGDSSAAATPVNYMGTSANNSAHGSQVSDSFVGMGGSDGLWGHGGDDVIWGDYQDPATPGSNLNVDSLYGQAGNDTIYGGVGADRLYGGSGDDTLYANGSNGMDSERNFLFGGSGNDTIVGSVGGDEIHGGTGADTITGGSGGDRFFYSSFADTGDTITDYTSGWDAFDFTALGLNYRFVGQVSSPLQLKPGEVGYVVSGGNTTLYLDGYGTEQGIDMEIHLPGVTRLSATDVWFG